MTTSLLQGDSLTVLRTLNACSVQCAVTSPPYYGLRDYGTSKWEGGDPACDHVQRRGGHLAVSVKHGRNYVGIELNPAYIELSQRRINGVQLVQHAS